MEIAKKESWNTHPMPVETAVLDYRQRFSPEEFEKISRGLIPERMEDKWFVYFDGTTLHLHRSWTGFCIYEVEFEKIGTEHVVRRAVANRDQAQYNYPGDSYDAALLPSLIGRLLVGRPVPFPIPQGLSQEHLKTFQHSISGTAFQEIPVPLSFGGRPVGANPWWKFWQRRRRKTAGTSH